MDLTRTCPECGAILDGSKTCRDRFDQMLAWEWEDPRNLVVHHLMVLSYHLQHPSRYSPRGLAEAKELLAEFLERGASPNDVRRRNRAKLDSGRRGWKMTGMPESHGSYDPPVQWTMTAADVLAGGSDSYCESVKAWAKSILAALKGS